MPDGSDVHRIVSHPGATRRWPIYVVAAVVLLYPLLFVGMFAGDAEIHLVYAENAAKGHFFEFNLGEKSAGVTSPGYMLLITPLYLIMPAKYVAAAVKLLGYLIWYAFVALLYPIARRLTGDHRWALAATLLGGLLPGSAYNSVMGMENGLFGLIILSFFYFSLRWQTTLPTSRGSFFPQIVLGALLGCGCWVRPEGFVISVLALIYLVLLRRRQTGNLVSACIQTLPTAVVCGLIAVAMLGFHYYETGYLLPTSGKARMMASWREAISIGPIKMVPSFTVRLAQYFPLTIFFLIGNALIFRRRLHPEHSLTLWAFLAVFWAFYFLYSFVLGAAHLARYVIFIMPYIVLIAVLTAQWLCERYRTADRTAVSRMLLGIFAGGSLVLLGVFSVETLQRLRLTSHHEVLHAMEAPGIRTRHSDELLHLLGEPTKRPVSLLFEEVQARYWLDDRFIIRSSDGRVDSLLLKFMHGRAVDQVGYVKERRVDYIMETQFVNQFEGPWLMSSLLKLKPGESVERDGVRFSPVCIDGKLVIWNHTNQPIFRSEILSP